MKSQVSSLRRNVSLAGFIALLALSIPVLAMAQTTRITGSGDYRTGAATYRITMNIVGGFSDDTLVSDLRQNRMTVKNADGAEYVATAMFVNVAAPYAWAAMRIDSATDQSLVGQWFVMRISDEGRTVSIRQTLSPVIAFNMTVAQTMTSYQFTAYTLTGGSIKVH